MADIDRHYALIARQEKKLDYAPVIKSAFEDAVIELGPNPSLTSLAEWLSGRVMPSASAKPEAKWTSQTVKDWLFFDGVEPTNNELRAFWKLVEELNQGQRRRQLREKGFRFTAYESWFKTKSTIKQVRGEERATFDKKKLDQHFDRISNVAKELREALRYR